MPTLEPTQTSEPTPTPVPIYDISDLHYLQPREGTKQGSQDIAVYDDVIFGFGAGMLYDNGRKMVISNGHGNNGMFGIALHGDYPYLYCGSWNRNDCKVYVNQIAGFCTTLQFSVADGIGISRLTSA